MKKIHTSKDGIKFKFKKYSYLNVVELGKDEDPDDFEDVEIAEVCHVRKKRVTGECRSHRPERVNEDTLPGATSSTGVSVLPPLSPELDTVRIYFDCRSFIDLEAFIPSASNKMVHLAQRGPLGNINLETTYYKTEFACSWFGKMQITKESRYFGKNAKNSVPVLSFEYSVAKWYKFTNGVNNGMDATALQLLLPCIQAMQSLHIENFSSVSMHRIAELFVERAEIRRFDLSLNFQVPPLYKPTDYIDLLARCRLNRGEAKREGEGSISFGTEKSPYRCIFYDKETEQRRYFKQKDTRAPFLFEEKGEQKVFDFNEQKTKFYKDNSHFFKNVIRFEIQFRPKFMQENNMATIGQENIDNVIRLGALYWRDILNRFDEQLGRANFEPRTEQGPAADVLAKLDEMRELNTFSRTVCNNMKCFVTDCYCKGWRAVYNDMGRNLFSLRYRWMKENCNYDVKVALPEALPIMRIMPTIFMSRQSRMIKDFRLIPAPVYNLVVG